MPSRIPYTRPSITEAEVALATEAARNGWGPRCYEYVTRFEGAFARWVGSKYAVATSSCTGALHLGLEALGLEPGDEVILADSNWIASCAPVVHLGATPVLVDVLEDSWCLDPQRVEAALTPRTRAIIAVHLYGNLCALDRLLALGARHGIPIIEDAAEAIGSQWHGRRAGSLGLFGVFSFHGTKTVTTGEGGMFVTNDERLYERVLVLNNHGRAAHAQRQFWPEVVGYKYRLSNVQAAIGCAQLERVDALVARKREILAYYRERLAGLSGLAINPEPPGTINGAWMPTVVFAPETGVIRERLQQAFEAADIDARVFFWPLSDTPALVRLVDTPVAHRLAAHGINLPSFHDITHEDLERVVETIHTVAAAGP